MMITQRDAREIAADLLEFRAQIIDNLLQDADTEGIASFFDPLDAIIRRLDPTVKI